MKRIALIFMITGLGACSTSTPNSPDAQAPVPRAPAPAALIAPETPSPPPAATAAPVRQESPLQLFERQRDRVEGESVYFPYDENVINPEGDSVINDHAKLASEFAHDHILVEGNCDERGGREYNLALGQRRADAVKSRLVLLGVPPTHVDTVSFGKEKPRALCDEERCWSQNRRADFVDSWK